MGDLSSIPGLGRCPGEGKDYPLHYSGLKNSKDYIVHGVTKSWTQLNDFHFHFSDIYPILLAIYFSFFLLLFFLIVTALFLEVYSIPGTFLSVSHELIQSFLFKINFYWSMVALQWC